MLLLATLVSELLASSSLIRWHSLPVLPPFAKTIVSLLPKLDYKTHFIVKNDLTKFGESLMHHF